MRHPALPLIVALAAAVMTAHAHAAAPTPASDMDCAVRYLTLAAGAGANPQVQQTFMTRAVDAGQRHAKANPSLDQQELQTAIQTQAQARSQKIGADRAALMDLFIDIRLCDFNYGYPLTPFPPQN